MRVGWFSQASNGKTRGNALKMHQERFSLDIRKNVPVERVVKHWDRLPREVMESSPLEMCKKKGVDVAL